MPWIESPAPGRYYVRWYEGKARKYRGPYPTRKDAKDARDRLNIEQRAGKSGAVDLRRPVAELWRDYLAEIEKTHAERTVITKRQNVEAFTRRFKEVGAIGKTAIGDWKAEMLAMYSVDTVALRLRDLRAFLSYCVARNCLAAHPMRGVEIPQSKFKGRCLTNAEIRKLLAAAPPAFKRFLVLALYTGARLSEIVNLRFEDLLQGGEVWHLRETKNHEERWVYLTRAARAALGKIGRGPVFPGWTTDTVHHFWYPTLRAAGIVGRVRVHDLRHTWASNFRGDQRVMMHSAGWKDPRMAKKYSHPPIQHLKEGMETVSYEGV